jgi:hypothetical protein
MTARESAGAGYRKSLTSDERRELAAIDAQAEALDKLRRELSLRRYRIVNRACTRAKKAARA